MDISQQYNCEVKGKRNNGTGNNGNNPSQERNDLGSIKSSDFGNRSVEYK